MKANMTELYDITLYTTTMKYLTIASKLKEVDKWM